MKKTNASTPAKTSASTTTATTLPPRKKKKKWKSRLALAFAAAAAFTSLGWAAGDYNSESTVQATVNYAIPKSYTTDNSSYSIYTNNGMYTDNDSYLKMKFNSTDIYKDLRPGCTYLFEVHGWTPNIDKATFVSTPTCPIAPVKTTYGTR